MKNGRTESIKSKLDLAIFAAAATTAVVVVVLPRRQDRRWSGECVCVVVASGWAARFGATQERRVCVSSLARFAALREKQDKVQVVGKKGHWKGRWGIRTFGCPLDPAKYFHIKASPMVLRM
jgi:hypothetical protein